jgi:hypothetical protein
LSTKESTGMVFSPNYPFPYQVLLLSLSFSDCVELKSISKTIFIFYLFKIPFNFMEKNHLPIIVNWKPFFTKTWTWC